MRNRILSLLGIVLILCFSFSCKIALEESSEGVIQLNIRDDQGSKGIEPFSSEIDHYEISIKDTGQKEVYKMNADKSVSTVSIRIPSGSYKVDVNAINTSSLCIGNGSANAVVSPGGTTAVSVEVKEFVGDGNFTISLTGPADLTLNLEIRNSEEQVIKKDTITFAENKYAKTVVLPNGFYEVIISVNGDGMVIKRDSFRIYKGHETAYSGVFKYDPKGNISITVDSTILVAPSFSVSLDKSEYTMTDSVHATSVLPEGTSYSARWSVDGNPKGAFAPYKELVLPVEGLSAGIHTVSLVIVDESGLVWTESATFNVKNSFPVASEPILNPVGTYPIVQGSVNVKIMVAQPENVQNFNTNEFTSYMENLTNVHVDYIQVPEKTATQELNLVLAGNDWPDAFLGFNINRDLESLYGVETGKFLVLDKYYSNEYMPNMMKAYSDIPYSIDSLRSSNGSIYSLSSFESNYNNLNPYKLYVYKPFLDKLNLAIPTTTQEFYDVLNAIKTQDPNGNGKADEVPFAAAANGWNTSPESFILNSFVYSDLDLSLNKSATAGIGFYLDNGTVRTIVNSAEYREGLKYLNKLYAEGLLNSNWNTIGGNELKNLVETSEKPVVGFVTGGWRGVFSDSIKNRFEEFRTVAPLAGPNGVREARNNLQLPTAGALVISSDSPYAEIILRYFDYMYSYEGILRASVGPKGTAWDDAEASTTGKDGEPAVWKRIIPWRDEPQNSSFAKVIIGGMTDKLANSIQTNLMTQDNPDYYKISNNDQFMFDEVKNLYKPYAHTSKQLPVLKFTAEEMQSNRTSLEEYANFVRTKGVEFINGTIDPNDDAVWSQYISDLNTKNLNSITALMQTAFDRQYK